MAYHGCQEALCLICSKLLPLKQVSNVRALLKLIFTTGETLINMKDRKIIHSRSKIISISSKFYGMQWRRKLLNDSENTCWYRKRLENGSTDRGSYQSKCHPTQAICISLVKVACFNLSEISLWSNYLYVTMAKSVHDQVFLGVLWYLAVDLGVCYLGTGSSHRSSANKMTVFESKKVVNSFAKWNMLGITLWCNCLKDFVNGSGSGPSVD